MARNTTDHLETRILAEQKTFSRIPQFIQSVRNHYEEEVFKNRSRFLNFKLSTIYLPGRNDSATRLRNLDAHVDYHFYNNSSITMIPDSTNLAMTPQLNISDYIKVMGEYITEEPGSMKAFTKLEIKVDLFELYLEAFARVDEYITWRKGKYGQVIVDKCLVPEEEEELTYHEKIEEKLLKEYLYGVQKFNEKVFSKYEQFEERVEDWIISDKRQVAKDRPSRHNTPEWIELLEWNLTSCIKIKYRPNNTELAIE